MNLGEVKMKILIGIIAVIVMAMFLADLYCWKRPPFGEDLCLSYLKLI